MSHILVVDDDVSLQFTLQAILEDAGYTVVVAGDGIEALAAMEHRLPALILLDLAMPRMDGFSLARELERRGLRSMVPIVVLTADGHAGQKAARVGADHFLAKPFSLDRMLEVVAHYVSV